MTKTKKNEKKWEHLIGCTGVIDNKGILHVHPRLKTFRVPHRSEYPLFTIIGDDNRGNVILTTDMLHHSLFPKELIKEIPL